MYYLIIQINLIIKKSYNAYNIEYKNGTIYTISYTGNFNNQLILSELKIDYNNFSFFSTTKILKLQDTKIITPSNKFYKIAINKLSSGKDEWYDAQDKPFSDSKLISNYKVM